MMLSQMILKTPRLCGLNKPCFASRQTVGMIGKLSKKVNDVAIQSECALCYEPLLLPFGDMCSCSLAVAFVWSDPDLCRPACRVRMLTTFMWLALHVLAFMNAQTSVRVLRRRFCAFLAG